MKTKNIFIVLLIVFVFIVASCFYLQQTKIDNLTAQVVSLTAQLDTQCNTAYTSQKGTKIIVYTPKKQETVSSTFVIMGKVPGNWSFEANFPITLKNSAGVEIAHAIATVQGDWMTTDFVPFTATIEYTAPQGENGTIILHKEDPSGLPDHEDSVSIPIVL